METRQTCFLVWVLALLCNEKNFSILGTCRIPNSPFAILLSQETRRPSACSASHDRVGGQGREYKFQPFANSQVLPKMCSIQRRRLNLEVHSAVHLKSCLIVALLSIRPAGRSSFWQKVFSTKVATKRCCTRLTSCWSQCKEWEESSHPLSVMHIEFLIRQRIVLNMVHFPNTSLISPLPAVGDLAQLLSGDPLLLLRLGHQHQRGPDPNWLAEGEGGGGSGCKSREEKSWILFLTS